MLKIICGENVVESREYYVNLKKEFKEKNYLIIEVPFANFFDKVNSFKNSLSLFSTKVAFFAENIIKKLSKQSKFKKLLSEFANQKDIVLVIWESLSARDIKNIDKKYIKEFKFSENVFKLLDAFYPGNFRNFHSFLLKISERMPEYLLFYLLVKRIHQLVVIKFSGNLSLPSWQLKRLKIQASYWSEDKLLKTVEALYKIDLRLKTSTTPFSLKDSLDILGSFVL